MDGNESQTGADVCSSYHLGDKSVQWDDGSTRESWIQALVLDLFSGVFKLILET